jgi:hypothetical protein
VEAFGNARVPHVQVTYGLVAENLARVEYEEEEVGGHGKCGQNEYELDLSPLFERVHVRFCESLKHEFSCEFQFNHRRWNFEFCSF